MFPAPLGGRYAIQHELAAGGYGRVYLAEDLRLGRPVAVKIVTPSPRVPKEEAVRRLEREARVAGAITHPNVCAVSDIGRLPDGLPYLVMELLSGESLTARIWRERRLAVDVALDFARQMLSGLAAAHRRGIIHRDVKPDNLFLTQPGPDKPLLKVLDFGTAQMPGSDSPHGEALTRTGYVIGTVQYMSPEQLKGVRQFDARTDVYSAAVVIYEMLTGKRPFHDIPDEAVAQAIGYSQAAPIALRVPDLPSHIAHVIDTALSTDHTKRPPDAGAFLEALRGSSSIGAAKIIAPHVAPKATADGEWDVPTTLAVGGSLQLSPEMKAAIARAVLTKPALPKPVVAQAPAVAGKRSLAETTVADWDLPTRPLSPAPAASPSEDDDAWDQKTTETGPRDPIDQVPDDADDPANR